MIKQKLKLKQKAQSFALSLFYFSLQEKIVKS